MWTAAFVQRLRELGWIEGRSIACFRSDFSEAHSSLAVFSLTDPL
jgi:hypothetical protein